MYKYIKDKAEIDMSELFRNLGSTMVISIDTEASSLDPYRAEWILFQVKLSDTIYLFDVRTLERKFVIYLVDLINSSEKLIIAHNSKYDSKMIFMGTGVWIKNLHDTMLVESFIYKGLGKVFYSLQELVAKYTGEVLEKEIRDSFIDFKGELSSEQLSYSAKDVLYLERIYDFQRELITQRGLERTIKLEMDLVPVVAQMELNGVYVDRDEWMALEKVAEIEKDKSYEKIMDIILDKIKFEKYDNGYILAQAFHIPVKTKKDKLALESITNTSVLKDWLRKEFNLNSHTQMLSILKGPFKLKVESTNEKILKEVHDDVIVPTLLEYREYNKKITTYGEDWLEWVNPKTGRVHSEFLQNGTDSGRFSSINPNLQQIPKDVKYRRPFRALPGKKILSMDYCLHPDTKVLKTDLSWVRIGDLKTGDDLIGIDEETSSDRMYRRMNNSVVESLEKKYLPSYKITLESGKVLYSSSKHKWLTTSLHCGSHVWTETELLSSSNSLLKFTDVWKRDSDYESGYIAGIFDGEASFSNSKRGCHISFYQLPGQIMDRTITYLDNKDISHSEIKKHQSGYYPKRTAAYIDICGVGQIMKLFGSIYPLRLYNQHPDFWIGRSPFKSGTRDRVVSVKFVGDMEVIAMRTSSRTFLAEGYWSHNSQQEYRLAGAITNDPVIINAYLSGMDMHTATAAIIFKKDPKDVTKEERNFGKTLNFAVLYGTTAYGLSYNLKIDKFMAQLYLDTFYAGYPTLSNFKIAFENSIWKKKFSSTMMGRKRYWEDKQFFRDFKEAERYESRMKREGFNHLVQGTGADVTKLAMIKLTTENPFGSAFRLVMQIHDEIVVEVDEEIAEKGLEFGVAGMESVFQPFLGKLPAKVDGHIDDCWSK